MSKKFEPTPDNEKLGKTSTFLAATNNEQLADESKPKKSTERAGERMPSTQALNKATSTLQALSDEFFTPTNLQRRAKAIFWTQVSHNPMIDPETVTGPEVARICGVPGVASAWKNPEFRTWFLGTNEFQARVEYLANLALDSLEDILLNDDPKTASARVNAVKVIAELASKFPRQHPNGSAHMLDQEVANMSKHQLEEFLNKNGIKMLATKDEPEVLNVTPK